MRHGQDDSLIVSSFRQRCSQWHSLKYECVYLNAFETESEARRGIGAWISYYTEKRPHSSHGLLTPAEAYDTANQNLKAAA